MNRWRVILPLLLSLSGACSSEKPKTSGPADMPPEVLTLTASPGAISPGDVSVIAWTTKGASEVVLSADGMAIDLGDAEVDAGSVVVQPSADTTYELVATAAASGTTATGSITVKVLEMKPGDVSLTATPVEIVAGEPVMLEWVAENATMVEIMDVPAVFSVSSTSAPFVDVSGSPTATTLPLDSCNASWKDEGCPIVRFPGGFTFPFDGRVYSEARIYVNGIISFDTLRTGPSHEIEALPAADQKYVHLAAFWTDLAAREHVYADLGEDAKGRFLVVQWHHVFWTKGSSDLTFEIILWDDGDFDFRYGDMDADEEVLGGVATIGYQNTTGTDGVLVTHLTPIPALAHSGYAFRMSRALAEAGSAIVKPLATRDYVLTAQDADGSTREATATVKVHPATTLVASASKEVVDEGDTFTIRWSAPNATAVVISEGGEAIHRAGPSEVAEGTLEITAAGVRTHRYSVEATGALGRSVAADLEVEVRGAFGLDSFDGDVEIPVGGTASLRWRTRGAQELSLFANGTALSLSGVGWEEGSVSVSPDNTTHYRLTISRADGRRESRDWTVRVLRARLDDAHSTADRGAAGGSTEIAWSASSPSGDPVAVRVYAMRELDAADAPFEEIGSGGTEVRGDAGTIAFPTGFVFPYLGVETSKALVASHGYLAFDLSAGANAFGTRLPTTRAKVHLAPFWDAIVPGETGKLSWKLVSDPERDRLIVQWKGYRHVTWDGTSGSLDFQVVLFADGSFDFRYGAMKGPDPRGANGGSAVIGFQDTEGLKGYSMVFHRAMPGGLSHRSFRFDAALAGSGSSIVVVPPGGRIDVCAVTAGDEECRVVTLPVDAPGDIALTELQLDPFGGVGAQWFEVRNVSNRSITLDGMEISSGSAFHTIAPDSPLVLPPGRYVTLAAGPSPGFSPDYVYGSDIPFDPAGGELSIVLAGVTLAGVEWDHSWERRPGVSLSLDGSLETTSYAAWPVSERQAYCDGVEEYAGTDRGSPGRPGRGCRSPYDVDFHASRPFIDISSTGAEIVFTDFDMRMPFGMPVAFPFFEADSRDDLVVRAIGEIAFALTCPVYHCTADLDEGGIAVLSSFDLAPQTGSRVLWDLRSVDARRVAIVQWNHFILRDRHGSITMQAQLWEGGDVVIVYPSVDVESDYLGDGWVGLWDVAATQTFLGFEAQGNLFSGQSFRFHRR